jgi:hypothetical protein
MLRLVSGYMAGFFYFPNLRLALGGANKIGGGNNEQTTYAQA